MITLEGAAMKGSAAFDALGISVKNNDGSMKNNEQLLNETIAALQGVEDESQRTALAQQLLGKKTAQELAPLLNSGAGSVDAMKDKLSEMGGVMSDDMVKSAAAYEDAMLDLETSTNGLKYSIGESLLPIITDLTETISTEIIPAITGFVKENQDWLIPVLGAVVAGFIAFKAALGVQMLIQGVTTAIAAAKAA